MVRRQSLAVKILVLDVPIAMAVDLASVKVPAGCHADVQHHVYGPGVRFVEQWDQTADFIVADADGAAVTDQRDIGFVSSDDFGEKSCDFE